MFYWNEEKDFLKVVEKCVLRGENWFDPCYIKRAVSISDKNSLCAILLTIEYQGFKSFHGFKFIKGFLKEQFHFCRRYILEENLRYSCGNSVQTKAVLKRLGFKIIMEDSNGFVMEKTPSITS